MSLDDERVQFYFKNRVQIEQWAALRDEAASAFDEWMCGLEPSMEELRAQLGADVQLTSNLDEGNSWPNFRFVRAAWGPATDEPKAAISLEWTRRRGSNPHDRFRPYVGIRSANTAQAGVALRASSEIAAIRERRREQSTAWWVALQYHATPETFPMEADRYRSILVDALRGCMDAYSESITNAQRSRQT